MSSSEEQEFDDKDNDEDDEDFEQNSKAANGDTHQDDDEEEDTKPAKLTDSGRKRRASARAKSASYKEDDDDDNDDENEFENGGNGDDDDDDSSDDDDLPLSALAVKPSPKPTKKKAPSAKKKAPSAKKAKVSTASPTKKAKSAAAAAPSSAKSAATTSSSGSSKNYEWASAALYGTNCDKGLLVQRLLCRWWYAYDWPATTSTTSTTPETVSSSSRTNGPSALAVPADVDLSHYDTLDGFPGVYICTSPEGQVGHLLDTRDASTAPTFGNFAKKSSQELQQLLIVALETQKTALVAAEGSGTVTESELDDLLKWARKVNVTKADKEAATILKAHRLSLP
jgi:hypothetical protein